MARKAQAQAVSTVTVGAFAAMSPDVQQALIAAGVAIVPDTATAPAAATTPKVTDADIIAAARSYTKDGKTVTRYTGDVNVTHLGERNGVTIGADAEGKGTRLMSYFVNNSGRVFAKTVDTYTSAQLATLSEALSAAARQSLGNVADVATLRAQISAASRRKDIIAALKTAGLAVPSGVDKLTVAAFRDWALEALGK